MPLPLGDLRVESEISRTEAKRWRVRAVRRAGRDAAPYRFHRFEYSLSPAHPLTHSLRQPPYVHSVLPSTRGVALSSDTPASTTSVTYTV